MMMMPNLTKKPKVKTTLRSMLMIMFLII